MSESDPIRASARRIAREVLAEGAAMRDRERAFPRAELAALGQAGLLGILVPEVHGGAGGDHAMLVAVIEEIAAVDGVCSMLMASQNCLSNMILLEFGSAEQHAVLAELARGERVAAFALTEPQSGSDAFRMKTTATREGGQYVLRGAKQFVTAGGNADYAVTFARTSDDKNVVKAFSAFLVPTSTRGYSVGKHEDVFGMRSGGTCQVTFEDMALPVSARIGAEGEGHRIAMAHLDRSRVAIGAQCVGLARGAYEAASRYAMERQAFGKPIILHQATSFRLADMATRVHAARLMCEDAARRLDAGQPATRESSMAKLFASEAAERVAHDAMQVLGGYGYLGDFPVERIYRDARVGTIYEGTSDIQRMLIANTLIEELRNA